MEKINKIIYIKNKKIKLKYISIKLNNKILLYTQKYLQKI